MKIVHADIALGASYRKCWTAELIEACVGLRAADTYANCIKAATPLPLQDLVVDLRERLCAVLRELDGADPRTRKNWLFITQFTAKISLTPLQNINDKLKAHMSKHHRLGDANTNSGYYNY